MSIIYCKMIARECFMGLHISHTPTIIGTKLEKTQNDNIEENEAELLLSAPAKIIKKEKENSYAA